MGGGAIAPKNLGEARAPFAPPSEYAPGVELNTCKSIQLTWNLPQWIFGALYLGTRNESIAWKAPIFAVGSLEGGTNFYYFFRNESII